MSNIKTVIRLGKYRLTTSGNQGYKTSIPKELVSKWGFEDNKKKHDVFLYAEKREDGKVVLIISKEKFEEDFL